MHINLNVNLNSVLSEFNAQVRNMAENPIRLTGGKIAQCYNVQARSWVQNLIKPDVIICI